MPANKPKIAINGFGRIGRAAFKIILDQKKYDLVAINDLASVDSLAYLLQYDTVYGIYDKKVSASGQNIVVNGKKYHIYSQPEPQKLPWKKLKVDVVLECTGRFVKNNAARVHLRAGAQKVIISAPAKGGNVNTFLLGVNEESYNKQKIVSNASCTTNCIAPVAQVMVKNFGVEKAMMTTIHSYTADQKLVDAPHKDPRRGRTAGQNIVPTTTGAAIATSQVIPELKGLFDGLSIRVPTPVVSLSDFTFVVKKNVTVDQVNQALIKASKSSRLRGVLGVTSEPVVSSDFIGDTRSSIVDLSLTKVVGNNLVKIIAWYDNEWGYANRLVDMIGQVV
ncbi:MAG: type I glyceraldehyde-3-phosphate dehydrogenase [Candidatus Komeilibacteria bacterium CG11_big_fil_rev_8_21_14_0_20_36_20]|uniref:Glyceraldehyde-3-phosphate dehydrogenase n=1 Tax=Candidatus Komeilibacteria bacterium CG11_big_fil_rev_8_21_14_0_20_36_20 TaxID=1974477 RepID=A0A2H0ND26_9BACT|nr:MAG: type I glyceraldehyde-3-phosphate dehydrogenase [Candidatus Komeilibacteria bacterium CG11_big_fil_rev_8_21_14_0_20_36_20]PIR82066.1 MAG: type I glyceraldehyde-3-phosphate dehydrogenase [Candidatus Komeilibacteria bacterium CG10_big_fil_rev_8_21_14_0_10_36_65]PJC55045.1 MAG: type I glyceraldehyde-3-phosphate dehydrogenase [Candidatus Komeilibacteria bacterium CG_4_9_14_0_2_um_filter_36_13]